MSRFFVLRCFWPYIRKIESRFTCPSSFTRLF